jgi:hypothetical protein
MRRRFPSALALALVFPVGLWAQNRESPGEGYQVQLRLNAASARAVNGELIAVRADSLWIRQDDGVRSMALGDLDRAQVRHHGFTFGKAMLIAAIGGLVTGGAMTAACSSVSDGCGSVFVGMMGSWLVVGAVAGAASSGSAYRSLEPLSYEALQPYARYPQGLPPGVKYNGTPITPAPSAQEP